MVAEHPEQSDSRTRNLALICLAALSAALLIALFKYPVHLSQIDTKLYRTALSFGVLIGLSGLYYHASRFYRDSLYLFIAISWLINLVYLLFSRGAPADNDPAFQDYLSFITLLALTTDVPNYLASRIKPGGRADYKDLVFPVVVISLWCAIYFYPFDPSTKSRAWANVILGIFFGTYVFLSVYRSFRLRLSNTSLENTESPEGANGPRASSKLPRRILYYTFFGLALIQFTYAFSLVESPTAQTVVDRMFYIALGIKIVNGCALLLMLREDYADDRAAAERTKERLHQERQERSELEEIGLLTASIEHELRTPLGVIKSVLNEMSRKYQNVDGVETDIQDLQTQRERLLNATKIIRVVRGGHEVFSKRMTTVNLTDLVRKAVKDLRKELNIDDVLFKYNERFGKPLATAHVQLLEQAVINILKNAVESIRATRKSGGEVVVTISKSNTLENYLVIDFKDNGGGFPEGSLDKLTQPDFSTKGKERANSGLGLFVCERIMKLHNGMLDFKPSQDGGAVVSICLPQAVTKKDRMRQNAHSDSAEAPVEEGMNVL